MARNGGQPVRTRAEHLRRELSDDIVSGRLPPGVRLDEQELASRFGVSRTPVREALRQLAAAGLVETRPHKGVVVTSISDERMREMFEVMAVLEASSARFAAQRMTAVERRRLEVLHERCRVLVQSGDANAYEAANLAFHNLVYKGSHNAFLADTALAVRSRLAPFRRAQFRVLGRLGKSYAEHDRVVQAILRGDGDAAFQAMSEHVSVVSWASADYVAGVRIRGIAGRVALAAD